MSLLTTFRVVDDLSPTDFEFFVRDVFAAAGWTDLEMTETGKDFAHGDGGIDIIAVRRVKPEIDYRMMVQCKKYSKRRKVGVEVVRQVWSVKNDGHFHNAMIATTSAFTKGASDQADSWKLELRDHNAIVDWCNAVVAPETSC